MYTAKYEAIKMVFTVWSYYYNLLAHWLLSSCVVMLLAYTTQCSVSSCSTPILRTLYLLQYAGMSIEYATSIVANVLRTIYKDHLY